MAKKKFTVVNFERTRIFLSALDGSITAEELTEEAKGKFGYDMSWPHLLINDDTGAQIQYYQQLDDGAIEDGARFIVMPFPHVSPGTPEIEEFFTQYRKRKNNIKSKIIGQTCVGKICEGGALMGDVKLIIRKQDKTEKFAVTVDRLITAKEVVEAARRNFGYGDFPCALINVDTGVTIPENQQLNEETVKEGAMLEVVAIPEAGGR